MNILTNYIESEIMMRKKWKKKVLSIGLALIFSLSSVGIQQIYAANLSSEASTMPEIAPSSSAESAAQEAQEPGESSSAVSQDSSTSTSAQAPSSENIPESEAVSSEEISTDYVEPETFAGVGETVIWSNNFETTVAPTGFSAPYWKNNLGPQDFMTTGFNVVPSAANLELEMDSTTKASGNYSFHASTNTTDNTSDLRLSFSKTVTIDYTKNYALRAKVKTNNASRTKNWVGAGAVLRAQVPTSTPTPPISHLMSGEDFLGTNDWFIVNIPIDQLQIRSGGKSNGTLQIEFFLNYFRGEVWIDDLELVETYTLALDKTTAKIISGDTLQLTPSGPPSGTPITWESTNPAVATVDSNGLVTAVAGGSATIKAYTDSNHIATCDINVADAASAAEFTELRSRWVDRVTGNPYWQGDAASTNSNYVGIIESYDADAKEASDLFVNGSSTQLFSDLTMNMTGDLANSTTSMSTNAATSAPYNTAVQRIFNMSRAWATKGSSYYHDATLQTKILYAMQWMYDNCYNENLANNAMFGNWYHWWISMPQNLSGAIIMMYDELPAQLIENESKTLANFNVDANYVHKVKGVGGGKMDMTSGNLADTSLVSLLRGVAGDDGQAMMNGVQYFSQLVTTVTSGEGIYPDGSFIQHTNLAYTGGYGATLLNGIEKIVYLTADTTWANNPTLMQSVYDFIWEGIRPLYADGAMLDMVSGRGIARPSSKDVFTGRGILGAVVLLADNAPAETKASLQSFAKEQLSKATLYVGASDYYKGLATAAMMTSIGILEDSSITADSNTGYAKVYGSMDKAVAHNKNFTFGVSYASARTGRFEFGNEENKLGWHQSDGATYIYNGDQAQYADGYWPTVDPQRLAGITTDASTWTLANWGNYKGNANFNGGVSVGQYAAVAMNFKNYATSSNPSLGAFKSWFVFGDEVVALGTGISGIDSSRTTETIVENKKVNGGNSLVVDGSAQSLTTGTTKNLTDVNWAWLEGNTATDSMGYYFPDSTKLNLLDESRTGSWDKINGAAGVDTTPITKEYISLAIPHGENTGNTLSSFKNEYYNYVLLPGKTQAEVEEYSNNPDIEVLSNSSFVQAVRDNKENVTSYIFWGNAGTGNTVRIGDVEAEKGAITVVKDTTKHTLTVGMSDVHQINSSLKFRIYGNNLTVATPNDAISVATDKYGAIVTVNTTGAQGKTFDITFNYQDLPQVQLDELADMRQTYADNQTGNAMTDKTDAEYRAVMDKYKADAQTALSQLNRSASVGTNLFNDIDVQLDWTKGGSNADGSANLTSTVTRIKAMALAYTSEGCTTYYQDPALKADLLFAINYLFTAFPNFQNYHDRVYANWWDWSIGVPKDLSTVGVLLYDELSPELREKIYQTIQILVPSASFYWGRGGTGKANKVAATAANGAEMAMILAVNGMIGNDPASLYQASDSLSSSLKYVTSGEGFYADGSYKQHGNFSYTGAYGVEMLRAVTLVVSITNGTTWQSTTSDPNMIYEWILNAYRPLYADGGIFDMVQGRSISRYTRTDITSGRYAMDAILTLCENVPAEYRDEILSFAKTQAKLGIDYDSSTYYGKLRFSSLIMVKKLINDTTIPLDTGVYTKIYGPMDKAAVHGKNYSLGISMFSKRNGAVESINNENLKGWFTSDGALSLYNGDQNQYANGYWATVDPTRLAGITTNHQTVAMTSNNIKVNDRTWVGGSNLGLSNYASIGQDFKTTVSSSDMSAKKSWFIFGDEVIALGADITTTTGDFAETIVENRKIDNNNSLFINGTEKVATNSTDSLSADWAWLSENKLGTGIGYYFPTTTTLNVKRETRTGLWSAVNTNNNPGVGNAADSATNDYISLAVNHGANPTGATYQYVLLPGFDKAQTQTFAQNNQIEILSNTPTVQAAADITQGVSGYNFWSAGSLDLTTSGITSFSLVKSLTPSSVTIYENSNTLAVGISDPTQLNGTTTIRLEGTDLAVISSDASITTTKDATGITITVNTANSSGASSNIILGKPGPNVIIDVADSDGNPTLYASYGDTIKLNAKPDPSAGSNTTIGNSTANVYAGAIPTAQNLIGSFPYNAAENSLEFPLAESVWQKGFSIGANFLSVTFTDAGGTVLATLTTELTINKKVVGLQWVNATGRTFADGRGDVTVTANSNSLVGSDTLTIVATNTSPTNAGSYTATATGLAGANASYYALPTAATCNYVIAPKTLTQDMFEQIASIEHTGSAHTPAVKISTSEPTLSQNDFVVAYTNNTNVGTATATITGQNNYSGTIPLSFKITQKNSPSSASSGNSTSSSASTGSNSKNSTTKSSSSPKTSDANNIWAWATVSLISLSGLVFAVLIIKKRKANNN